MPCAVRTLKLNVAYGEGPTRVHAIRDLDLEIPAGDLVVALGPSGCGKTTLLKVITGLQRPTSGEVYVGDTLVSELDEDAAAVFRRRHIGIVFQFFNLIPGLTVRENVAMPMLWDGARLDRLGDRIDGLLNRLGIWDRRDHYIDELSGGELQRAAIARAILPVPELIVADEPTGNLHTEQGRVVLELLRELSDGSGTTVLLLTHDLRAVSYARRAIRLRDGRIEEDLPV